MPVIFSTLKGAALLKQAAPLLARWNKLPPEQQEQARQQARDVMAAVACVRRALGDHFADEEETVSWEEARAEALDPPAFFSLAKRLVELLRTEGPLDGAELARKVGTGDPSDELFCDALAVAADDGYIEMRGTEWRVTEFADHKLSQSEHVRFLEDQLVQHLEEEGLADQDELALAVGADDFLSPEFQAPLERALAAGSVWWIRPSTYGLPLERLVTLSPPDDEPSTERDAGEEVQEQPSLGASLRALGGSLRALQSAMQASSGSSHRASAGPPENSSAKDPLEQLERLGDLKERGLLSEAEFDAKKAEFLSRV